MSPRATALFAVWCLAVIGAPVTLRAAEAPASSTAAPPRTEAPSRTEDDGEFEFTVKPLQQADPALPGKKMEEITVLGLQGRVIDDFIKSYAAPVPNLGLIARWRTPICPTVVGLVDYQGALVANRVRNLATKVGVKVTPPNPNAKAGEPGCKPNVWIIFSSKAQDFMDKIRKEHPWLLGFHYFAQAKKLATITSTAQSWYATETVDAHGVAMLDSDDYDAFDSGSGEMRVSAWLGGRIKTGTYSQFADTLVVVDFNHIKGVPLPSIADYVAMLALAQTRTFDVCRQLPSITNLFAKDCDPDKKTKMVSDADVAYLRALYQLGTEGAANTQAAAIASQMRKNMVDPEP